MKIDSEPEIICFRNLNFANGEILFFEGIEFDEHKHGLIDHY